MSSRKARLTNVVGAFAQALSDRTAAAAEAAAGVGGAGPAALVTIATRGGLSLDELRRVLGVSQPATVRIVDRLIERRLARRRPGRDGRTIAIWATAAGERRAAKVLDAQRAAVAKAIGALDPAQSGQLTRLLEQVLESLPATRADAWHLCRLCDHASCPAPRCPVDRGVNVG